MALVATNAKEKIRDLKKYMKKYRIAVQTSTAESLTKTRLRAADIGVLPGSSTWTNPYKSRKDVPSTSGRVTSRTGKLKYMLEGRKGKGNPLQGWTGFGRKIAKEKTPGLIGSVRAFPSGKGREKYKATYRILIGHDSRLYYKGSKDNWLPVETTDTLSWRLKWEYRGRAFIKPVLRQTDFDFRIRLGYLLSKISTLI